MIIHIVKKINLCNLSPVDLFCTPTMDAPVFRYCAETYRARRVLQVGADLGMRMYHAFEQALEEHPWAILVGSDCPSTQCSDLRGALAHLQAGGDAVIGPAADGGYYLIGLRSNNRSLFAGIPWGTQQVFALTEKVMKTLAWDVRVLPVRRDIDTPQDLAYLPELEQQ